MSHSAPAMLIEIRDPRFPLVMIFSSSSSASSLTEYASLLEHSTPFYLPSFITISFLSYTFIAYPAGNPLLIRSSFARSFAVCDDRSPSRTRPSSIGVDPKSVPRLEIHAGPRGERLVVRTAFGRSSTVRSSAARPRRG